MGTFCYGDIVLGNILNLHQCINCIQLDEIYWHPLWYTSCICTQHKQKKRTLLTSNQRKQPVPASAGCSTPPRPNQVRGISIQYTYAVQSEEAADCKFYFGWLSIALAAQSGCRAVSRHPIRRSNPIVFESANFLRNKNFPQIFHFREIKNF